MNNNEVHEFVPYEDNELVCKLCDGYEHEPTHPARP